MKPDFDFIMSEFGGYDPVNDFKEYTNIITVNGDLDPWLPGCLQVEVNEDMPVLTIKNGGHHAETFLPIENEDSVGPGSNIRETRAKIESYLEKWISRHEK